MKNQTHQVVVYGLASVLWLGGCATGTSSQPTPPPQGGEAVSQKGCPMGQVAVGADAQGGRLCCWPGQKARSAACSGTPRCPSGTRLQGAQCLPLSSTWWKMACETHRHLSDCVTASEQEDLSQAERQESTLAACQLGDEASCAKVDASFDALMVKQTWEVRCKARDPNACAKLAFLRQQSPEDAAKVRPAWAKACKLGDKPSCYTLALMYRQGQFGPRQVGQAKSLYKQLCASGEQHVQACYTLGQMYERGPGGRSEPDEAAKLWAPMCAEHKHLPSCSALGLLHELGAGKVSKDVTKARGLYEQACEGGIGEGCERLGELSLWGRGVEEDYKKAVNLFKVSCDTSHARGCLRLGQAAQFGWSGTPDFKEARALFKKACELGDAEGCVQSGLLLEAGLGGKRDKKSALALYQTLCETSPRQGCYNLGYLHEFGRGVKRDPARARALYEKSCSVGSEDACRRLLEMKKKKK